MVENRFQVSVIIPVFNCREYIAETLESVLEQSFPAFEIIVVDSSTDGTSEIIQKYRSHIKYIFQDKQGIGKARNQGIVLARGNFFAHLD
ncbi:MAG: glycosyltransferase, partial [Bacteroidales bacterium]|nr:glycosyltransferase [Bacteroidales bacterium]